MQQNTAQTPGNADSQDQGWLALFAFVALCLVVGGVGGIFTAGSVETWYPTLDKPPFNPPNWVFGPVWTALYVLMGAAAWRVWRAAGVGTALGLFALQLVLNALWMPVAFGAQALGWALLIIVALWIALAATLAAFWRADRFAGLLLAPYLAWVSYAVYLNAGLLFLN